MLREKTVAFLGAGSMAESMISGIVQVGIIPAENIYVTNRSNQLRLEELNHVYGVNAVHQNDLPYEEIDLFILAMKPQGAADSLRALKDKVRADQVVISVLAGISTTFMEDHLRMNQQVVRVMPNTSSMIQESATALSPGRHTAVDNVLAVKELLSCMGKVFLIEEEQMDIFTGIAGSGPAYFYYLMEHMEQAGVEKGMDEEMVREIVAQTILGAAKMIMANDEAPASLRKKVTSPNGTTASGLEALRKNNGGKAISQAVHHAAKRSKELNEEMAGALVTS
ncbi:MULTISPECIES: pyrroline-5-carboxylate reductase [Metabacillus]|uniref:Pyrroline-5-carboxylate reductase n=1 Tax=Metabacillus hrfriensis TaxID=3048891 RepID=A0ACD4RD34_9BACI|nr:MULTISPECIES: pyrroline-5-carboxylate reductase [Metabacillus]UAL52718.1 pyrroline-5-carboxylate reductase [Metabacillus dongyingensis]USK29035.1 pyrroline-5-carboxylate reductase [Bacillus sp. CMF21]WHZ58253.1 pyrroline-5-carboxylate reductase [Metabacillus sp. CT-WN-B3]